MRCLLLICLAALSLSSIVSSPIKPDNDAILEFFNHVAKKIEEQAAIFRANDIKLLEDLIASVPVEKQGRHIAGIKIVLNHLKSMGNTNSILGDIRIKIIADDIEQQLDEESRIFKQNLFSLEQKRRPLSDEMLHNEVSKAAAILKAKVSPDTLRSEYGLFEAIQQYIDSDDDIAIRADKILHLFDFSNENEYKNF